METSLVAQQPPAAAVSAVLQAPSPTSVAVSPLAVELPPLQKSSIVPALCEVSTDCSTVHQPSTVAMDMATEQPFVASVATEQSSATCVATKQSSGGSISGNQPSLMSTAADQPCMLSGIAENKPVVSLTMEKITTDPIAELPVASVTTGQVPTVSAVTGEACAAPVVATETHTDSLATCETSVSTSSESSLAVPTAAVKKAPEDQKLVNGHTDARSSSEEEAGKFATEIRCISVDSTGPTFARKIFMISTDDKPDLGGNPGSTRSSSASRASSPQSVGGLTVGASVSMTDSSSKSRRKQALVVRRPDEVPVFMSPAEVAETEEPLDVSKETKRRRRKQSAPKRKLTDSPTRLIARHKRVKVDGGDRVKRKLKMVSKPSKGSQFNIGPVWDQVAEFDEHFDVNKRRKAKPVRCVSSKRRLSQESDHVADLVDIVADTASGDEVSLAEERVGVDSEVVDGTVDPSGSTLKSVRRRSTSDSKDKIPHRNSESRSKSCSVEKDPLILEPKYFACDTIKQDERLPKTVRANTKACVVKRRQKHSPPIKPQKRKRRNPTGFVTARKSALKRRVAAAAKTRTGSNGGQMAAPLRKKRIVGDLRIDMVEPFALSPSKRRAQLRTDSAGSPATHRRGSASREVKVSSGAAATPHSTRSVVAAAAARCDAGASVAATEGSSVADAAAAMLQMAGLTESALVARPDWEAKFRSWNDNSSKKCWSVTPDQTSNLSVGPEEGVDRKEGNSVGGDAVGKVKVPRERKESKEGRPRRERSISDGTKKRAKELEKKKATNENVKSEAKPVRSSRRQIKSPCRASVSPSSALRSPKLDSNSPAFVDNSSSKAVQSLEQSSPVEDVQKPSSEKATVATPTSTKRRVTSTPRRRRITTSLRGSKSSSKRDTYSGDTPSSRKAEPARGPYLQVISTLKGDVSHRVVNTASDLNSSDAKRRLPIQCELENLPNQPRVGFASAFSKNYEAFIVDPTWICIFCRKRSHEARLGDLLGPCFVVRREEADTVELAGLKSPAGKQRRKSKLKDPPVEAVAPAPTPPATVDFTTARYGDDRLETWFHEACLVWSPEVHLTAAGVQGVQEAVTASRGELCAHCGYVGATVGCVGRGCRAGYHLPCAEAASCQIDEENFTALCSLHKKPG